jgi:hypothetical protein
MAELVLFAEFTSREDAKANALAIVAAHGKSPTLRRSGTGWGLFAPRPLIAKIQSARTPRAAPVSASRKLAPVPKPSLATNGVTARTPALAPVKPVRKGTWSMTKAEARQMASELRHAYRKLSSADASEWLGRMITRFGFIAARRVRNLGGMALTVVEVTGEEILGLIKAILENRTGDHVAKRVGHGSRKAADFVNGVRSKAAPLIAELKKNPAEVAPDLLIVALSFYVAGGGFDGDGGIPDSDIALLGIDAHRSIFTHSIVAGAVVETALYSLVDFIAIAHKHLPREHDPRWTLIHDRFERAAASGAKGMSLGLAYHLGVDGLIQPGAYHDIPFEMSMNGHQAILTANAAAEGMDSLQKGTKKPQPQAATSGTPASRPPPKPKERNIAGLVTGAAALAALLLGFG